MRMPLRVRRAFSKSASKIPKRIRQDVARVLTQGLAAPKCLWRSISQRMRGSGHLVTWPCSVLILLELVGHKRVGSAPFDVFAIRLYSVHMHLREARGGRNDSFS